MPQLSFNEIVNLRRTFTLYAFLPEKYYPDVEKCERDYLSNKKLLKEHVSLRWDLV